MAHMQRQRWAALARLAATPAARARAAEQAFTVTTLADTNDGMCNAHRSLREAINAAQATPDAGTVKFAATGTIALGGNLPLITQPGGDP